MAVRRPAASLDILALPRTECTLGNQFEVPKNRMHCVASVSIQHLNKALNAFAIHCSSPCFYKRLYRCHGSISFEGIEKNSRNCRFRRGTIGLGPLPAIL